MKRLEVIWVHGLANCGSVVVIVIDGFCDIDDILFFFTTSGTACQVWIF